MGCNCGNKGTKSTVPVETVSVARPVVQVDQGKPACNRCGCNPCACKEDHTVKLIESSYTTTVCTCGSWVMPAVGESVQLHLNQVTDLLPGAILYNPSVGHLHVQSYDRNTGYVLAVNQGGDDNAEGGTTFPEGICFHVGVPVECDCAADWTGPCLAADFTSPAIGDTAQAAVTTVSGLFVYDTIDIGGYMYKIVEITDANSITVKNEGYGAPVGTVIKADPKCSGRPCQVKITVINNDNPCMQEPVKEGLVLVCDEGTPKPIVGEATGQVLGWDNEDGVWKLVNAGITDKCTFTTKCSVTLDPQVTTYLIYLSNPGIFEVGDTFTLDGTVYNVAEVHTGSDEDSNYVRANRSAPTEIGSIPKGTTVCNDNGEGCDLDNWCDQIKTNRDNINIIMGPTWRPTALTPLSIAGSVSYTAIGDDGQEGVTKDLKKGDATFSPNRIPALNLQVPANLPSSYRFGLIGQATVYYVGDAYCDSHYDHIEYKNHQMENKTTGGLLHMIHSNQMRLIVGGTARVNGVSHDLGLHTLRQDFTFTPRNNKPGLDPSGDAKCWGKASQTFTMPFALNNLSAPGGSIVEIIIGSEATCMNPYNKDDHYPGDTNVTVNDDIHTLLHQYKVIFNAMLVIQ